ncbi:hypothetical protein BC628DRAFT_1077995 [Trametes gibbosa]|nr:hypothetical protein BC628DRAFT_1077995 [Trametes gibbosa]
MADPRTLPARTEGVGEYAPKYLPSLLPRELQIHTARSEPGNLPHGGRSSSGPQRADDLLHFCGAMCSGCTGATPPTATPLSDLRSDSLRKYFIGHSHTPDACMLCSKRQLGCGSLPDFILFSSSARKRTCPYLPDLGRSLPPSPCDESLMWTEAEHQKETYHPRSVWETGFGRGARSIHDVSIAARPTSSRLVRRQTEMRR